jgi:hypothetical protein
MFGEEEGMRIKEKQETRAQHQDRLGEAER